MTVMMMRLIRHITHATTSEMTYTVTGGA